jgi:hypothetical protein
VRAGEESGLPVLLQKCFRAPLRALAAAEVGELLAQGGCRAPLKEAVEPRNYLLIRAVSKARERLLEQRAVLALQLPECQALHVPEAYSGAMVAVGP